MKLVINDSKASKSYQKEVPDDRASMLVGKKIGDEVEGAVADLPGYKLKVTGGSDKEGFPMRPEILGNRRIKLLLAHGTGIRKLPKGSKETRRVVGNSVSKGTAQVNAKITGYGPKTMEELGYVTKAKEAKPAEEKK